jgi:hypothetical protein
MRDKDREKPERPKKTHIAPKGFFNNGFIDNTPISPEVPHVKSRVDEYEKINHREKIQRNQIVNIPQADNIFNFEPMKDKYHKKMVKENVPSLYYSKMENYKNRNNFYCERPCKMYNDIGRKDNLNEIFKGNLTEGNVSNRNRNYKTTQVQQIFENGKNNIPVGYKEPTACPGKVDFEQLSTAIKQNYEEMHKYSRKPLKKDF